jgi:hypothetical protein
VQCELWKHVRTLNKYRNALCFRPLSRPQSPALSRPQQDAGGSCGPSADCMYGSVTGLGSARSSMTPPPVRRNMYNPSPGGHRWEIIVHILNTIPVSWQDFALSLHLWHRRLFVATCTGTVQPGKSSFPADTEDSQLRDLFTTCIPIDHKISCGEHGLTLQFFDVFSIKNV